LRRIRYRRFGRPLSYVALFVGAIKVFRDLSRTGWRPEVVHTHQLATAFPALLLRLLYRVPVVYTEHWTIFLPENPLTLSRQTQLAAKFAISHADRMLPVSRAWQDAVVAQGFDGRFRVVPNVVDTHLFRPPEQARTRNGLRLLSVGHLDGDAKGVDLLLHATRTLRDRGHAVQLYLVGDGPDREKHEALARDLGIDDVVRFYGLLPKVRVADLMREVDVFVLASRFENSPCVLVEAASAGLPAVATDVGGVSELVTHDVGVLARPGDPDAIADAVERMLEALSSFDPHATSAAARRRFSIEAVGRVLGAVYAELVPR